MTALRLGTRGSQLALWQAHNVAEQIARRGGPACEIVVIRTSGDRQTEASLSDIGGKRLFVKEIEDALLAGTIDLAVHSSKDLPAVLPDGLDLAAVPTREDPHDVLVLSASSSARPQTIEDLRDLVGETPRVGTGSVRRVAQLKRLWPKADFLPIRGNIDTRLRKVDEGQYDLLVLAAAGLRRLGQSHRISLTLPTDACVPAPGQGAIAIEIRADADDTRTIAERVNDPAAAAALTAERALVETLGGGCQAPIGALAVPVGSADLDLHATVVSLDGSLAVSHQARGTRHAARELGARVASQLMEWGATEILDAARREQMQAEGTRR